MLNAIGILTWIAWSAVTVGGPPSDPPGPYVDARIGSVEEAKSLVVAMGINNDSLDSMVWEQRNERFVDGAWETAEESLQYVDGPRSGLDQTMHLIKEDGTPVQSSVSVRFDGHLATLVSRNNHRGTIREHRPTDDLWATPLKFMGRGVDTSGRRTLSEILLSSEDLHMAPVTDPAIRAVSGYCEVNGRAWVIEALLDPAKGFAPVRITVYDGLLFRPIERLEVTAWDCRNGIWIPTGGTDALWCVQTGNDQLWAKFQAAVEPLALRPEGAAPSDPAVRKAYHEAITSVYGVAGIPVQSLGPPHRLTVKQIRSVNEPPPKSITALDVADATVTVDFFLLKASNGRPVGISP